jgi:hypothetical protein
VPVPVMLSALFALKGTRFGRRPWRTAASGTVSGSLQLPRLLRTPGVWEGMLGAYWDKL